MNRCQSGMTLIELVVALALLALIVGGLAAVLGAGVSASASVEARAQGDETLRVAQTTLRRYLGQARPVKWRAGAREQIGFVGEAQALGFTAVMPPWPGAGGLYRVRVAIEDRPGGKALVLRRAPTAGERMDYNLDAAADAAVLAEGVSALRWSYWGVEDGARAAAWRADWRGQRHLPRLVRLDLQFADPRAPAWPPLVIALRLDEDQR
ncbi:MAG: prepilin-type N-terminal cleavage/methylation domain-containing protein [Rhodospirillales bacterium]